MMENDINFKKIFGGIFEGKKVLVTGHTGFKGGWLSTWLVELGAEVLGYSIDIPTEPSYFEIVNLKKKIKHVRGDIRDFEALNKVFNEFKPEIVFHLAAQAITRLSYDIPRETFFTNIGGTVNVLDCLRNSPSVKAVVIITSDKCYFNSEWEWGYRENDKLGGSDPYSASKSCAEIVTHSYMNSFFSSSINDYPRVATARAGNVIGGGDWAQDRVVPDCVRAWRKREEPIIRYPDATRPWLHVLEPLSGYLLLAAYLLEKPHNITNESFNFGPDSKYMNPVRELVLQLLKIWGAGDWRYEPSEDDKKESAYLKLCSDKALQCLKWQSVLTFSESVELTAEWYKNYYNNQSAMYDYSCEQIKYYIQKAKEQNISWVNLK